MNASSTFISLDRLLTEGRNADHPVCCSDADTLTWKAFASKTLRQTQAYRLTTAERWLINTADPIAFAAHLFALWHSGKTPIIPPSMQPGWRNDLKNHYDAIVCDPPSSQIEDSTSFTPLNPETCKLVLYTSGTTGAPKGIVKTLSQLDAEISLLESLWGDVLGDVAVISTVPVHHIYGLLFRLLWPMASGRALDARTYITPEDLLARMQPEGSYALVSSPAQLDRIVHALAEKLPFGLCFIFSSGGPLSKATCHAFASAGCAPVEIYGSSETGGIAWRQHPEDSSWIPFPGIDIRQDADGALFLSSSLLPDQALFRMEDAIELLPGGRFNLLGRLDRTVKIGEKRVALPDIELRLTQHPWIISAATTVILSAEQHHRQSLGAAVVLSQAGKQQLVESGRRHVSQHLREYLNQYFDGVLLPRYWRFMDELPFNERGKISKTSLEALFSDRSMHATA